jgi:hypothetical protein
MAEHVTDVNAISYGRLIGLNTNSASPPTNAYISADDSLGMQTGTAQAGQTITIFIRILLPDGTIVPYQQTVNIPGQRTSTGYTFQLTEGFLLSVTVASNNFSGAGATYVSLFLSRGYVTGGATTQVLCQGYVSGLYPLSWPNGLITPPWDGRGRIRSITGTTPGAGVNVSEVVPLGALWRLMAFQVRLVTSAAAATRGMVLTFDDGTNVFASVATTVTQAASLTTVYSFIDGVNGPGTLGTVVNNPLPREMYLQPNYRIRTAVALLDPGDQLSAPQYLVEEWIQQ